LQRKRRHANKDKNQYNETSSFRSSIQWVYDYEKVLKRGFNGIRREAEEKLAPLDPLSPRDICEKKPFLEAVVIVCEAIVLWAKRHAALLARETAAWTSIFTLTTNFEGYEDVRALLRSAPCYGNNDSLCGRHRPRD
jgi:hypothetical protein